MKTSNKQSVWVPSKIIISEAIIIATLTAVGYLAAFAYQYSYLNYFGIPWSFIDVSLSTVLFVTLAIVLWMTFVIFSFGYFSTFKEDGWRGLVQKIGFALIFFVGIFIPTALVMYDPTSVRYTLFGWGALLIVFISYLIKIFRNKDTPKTLPDIILDGIEEKHGSFSVILIIVLILFMLCSVAMGSISAKEKTDFLTVGRNSNQAVISTFSGNLITLTFSTSTKKFTNEISVINLERISSEKIILINNRIGPLHP